MGRPGEPGIVIPFNRSSESLQALARLAMVDDVTGLNNRRFLFQYLEGVCSEACDGVPLVLSIIDLDHFKVINDAYGHLCGDAVLASFASFLRARLRRDDIAVRYAGDEFVLVFPAISVNDACGIVQRLCKEAAEQLFASDVPGRRVAVTFSAGLAGFPEDGSCGRDLVRRADAALYLAKQLGRNQVRRSDEVSQHPFPLMNRSDGIRSRQIIGRERELGLLQAALQAGNEGRGQMVLLAGEAGIGKSRCASHLQQVATHLGFTVLSGRCHEHTASMPFWALTDLLRDSLVAGGKLSLDDLAGYLPSLVKLLPELDSLAAGAPLVVEQLRPEERNLFFSGICRFLVRLSEEAPLMLRLDDLHWVDRSTSQFLSFLGRQMTNSRIVAFCSYRPEEIRLSDPEHPLTQLKNAMAREDSFRIVTFGRLHRADVARMACSIFDLDEVAEGFASFLYRESEGNPFFVEQILQTLFENDALYRSPQGWDRKRRNSLSLPPSIRELFQNRLTRLAPQTREVLSLASVFGEAFDFDTLMDVSGLNEGFLLDILDEARSTQLIEESSDDGNWYRFTHSKIRQVLYEEMNARRRRRLHQLIAEALENRGKPGEKAAELSYHFVNSGDGKKAWKYSLLAAENAERLLAFHEAETYLRQAGQILKSGDIEVSLQETGRYNLALGQALMELGRYGESRDALRHAFNSFKQAGESQACARVEAMLAMCDERCGEFDSALRHLDCALNLLGNEKPDLSILSAIYRTYSAAHIQQGNLPLSLEFAQKLLAVAREADSSYDIRRSILLLGSVHYEWDHFAEAENYFREGIALSAGEADSLRARFINNLGAVAFHHGQWDEAHRQFSTCLELARGLGDVQLESILLGNLCELHTCWGDYEEAARFLEACIWLGERMGAKGVTGNARLYEGELRCKQGRYAEGLASFDAALHLFKEMDSRRNIAYTFLMRATAHARLGQFEEAWSDHAAGEALAGKLGWHLLLSLSSLTGARIASCQGDLSQTLCLARKSAAGFRALQRPFEEALSLLLEAEARRRMGDDSASVAASLQRAYETFKSLRAEPELTQTCTMLQELSGALHGPPPEGCEDKA